MMLRYSLGCESGARKIEEAVAQTIDAGLFTRELGGSLSTEQMAEEIARRLH